MPDFFTPELAGDITPWGIILGGLFLIFRGKLAPDFYIKRQDKELEYQKELNRELAKQNRELTEALRESTQNADQILKALPPLNTRQREQHT